MNVEMVLLRLLHIVFGVFWAGSAVLFALIIEPRVKTLGPSVERGPHHGCPVSHHCRQHGLCPICVGLTGCQHGYAEVR